MNDFEEIYFDSATEASQILNRVKLYKSKLKSQEEHLSCLIRKEARLQNEILLLRRTMKRQQQQFKQELQLKNEGVSESYLGLDEFMQENLASEASAELNLEIRDILKLQARLQADLEDLKKLIKSFS